MIISSHFLIAVEELTKSTKYVNSSLEKTTLTVTAESDFLKEVFEIKKNASIEALGKNIKLYDLSFLIDGREEKIKETYVNEKIAYVEIKRWFLEELRNATIVVFDRDNYKLSFEIKGRWYVGFLPTETYERYSNEVLEKLNFLQSLLSGYTFREIKGEGYEIETPSGSFRHPSLGICTCLEFRESGYRDCIHLLITRQISKYRSLIFDYESNKSF